MPPIRLAFVDFDGTLVDSSPLHEQAFQETLPWGSVLRYEAIAGMPTMEAIHKALPELPMIKVQELCIAKRKRYKELVSEKGLKLFPGALELLSYLKNEVGAFVCISTGAALHRSTLESFGICFENIDRFMAGVDKPRSRAYFQLRYQMGLSSDQCLVIEDSLTGVEMAKQNNVPCLGVHNMNLPVVTFASLESLLAHLRDNSGSR